MGRIVGEELTPMWMHILVFYFNTLVENMVFWLKILIKKDLI
jgi:hypothetical protein